MPARVSLINLGCPKNLVDAEVMLGQMHSRGFELTGDPTEADVVIVNTCGFLAASVRESLETLAAVSRLKATGRCRAVIAAGCMAQRYGDALAEALPEVDGIVGVGQALALPEVIERALAGDRPLHLPPPAAGFEAYDRRLPSTPRWTAYVKLSEGCDRHCSFCAIPAIRGPMVSRPAEAILREVEALVARGVREVILIGQDPNRYGVDRGEGHALPRLLEALAAIPDLRWIRLMYLFPDRHLVPILATAARLPRVCAYVDVPMQHASPAILRAMNRPGSGDEFLAMLAEYRSARPEAFVRSTFIVGFPGETEAHFRELLDFLAAAELDWVGAFEYSREEGTPAAARRPVARRVRRERYHRLMSLQREITARRLAWRVGSRAEAVIERIDPEGAVGRIYGQAPEIDGETWFEAPLPADVRPGDFVEVAITGAREYDLVARVERLLHRPPLPAPRELIELQV